MIDIVLFEPEIPPNTGNIIRLCANFGAQLHLIEPYGFTLDDRRLRRAGLDYREWADVKQYASLPAFISAQPAMRLVPFTTRATELLSGFGFKQNDALMFGPETRGLPQEVLDEIPKQHWLRIPMLPHSRSLNLSNAVAIACYEAGRQLGFPGAA